MQVNMVTLPLVTKQVNVTDVLHTEIIANASARKCPGRGKSGCPCSDSCPHDPAPDKRTIMDGWMASFQLLSLVRLLKPHQKLTRYILG